MKEKFKLGKKERIDKVPALVLLKRMLLIRRLEETLGKLFSDGEDVGLMPCLLTEAWESEVVVQERQRGPRVG